MVFSGDCYPCAWENCVSFCRFEGGSVDDSEVCLAGSVLQGFRALLISCPVVLPITEIFTHYSWAVYFALQFCQLLLPQVFWDLVIRYVCVCDCCAFLMKQLFHYKISLCSCRDMLSFFFFSWCRWYTTVTKFQIYKIVIHNF